MWRSENNLQEMALSFLSVCGLQGSNLTHQNWQKTLLPTELWSQAIFYKVFLHLHTAPWAQLHSYPSPPLLYHPSFPLVPFVLKDSFNSILKTDMHTGLMYLHKPKALQMRRNRWHWSFWNWLGSFNTITSGCIHFAADSVTLFFLKAENDSAVHLVHFSYPSSAAGYPVLAP